MLNIQTGRLLRPQKIVIYGSEGIGKTSLAAQCPDPLFIDTEGGSAHLEVRRTQKPQSWEVPVSGLTEFEDLSAAAGRRSLDCARDDTKGILSC
jgi:hypothetical protein